MKLLWTHSTLESLQGLGKTLSTLALIRSDLSGRDVLGDELAEPVNRKFSKATLIGELAFIHLCFLMIAHWLKPMNASLPTVGHAELGEQSFGFIRCLPSSFIHRSCRRSKFEPMCMRALSSILCPHSI